MTKHKSLPANSYSVILRFAIKNFPTIVQKMAENTIRRLALRSLSAVTDLRDDWLVKVMIALGCFFCAVSGSAQTSLATLPAIKLSKAGGVTAIAFQGDGKIIIGGWFS